MNLIHKLFYLVGSCVLSFQLIILAGCERNNGDAKATCSQPVRPSEQSGLEHDILNINTAFTNKGFRTSSLAVSIANGIKSLDDVVQRKRLATLYFEHMGRIDPLADVSAPWDRVLHNYAQLFEACEILRPYLDDPEQPLVLMSNCLRDYHRAIQAVRNREMAEAVARSNSGAWQKVGGMKKTWNYEAGLARFAFAVTNNYLPVMSKTNLSKERCGFWRKKLFDDISRMPQERHDQK